MKIPAKGFTHGGKFHADDVFATALLMIVRPDIKVTRGFVVPDGDPIAMGEKLAQLICQDDLRNRLGDQAHSYAQQYAWEKITQQIITVYRELTSRG